MLQFIFEKDNEIIKKRYTKEITKEDIKKYIHHKVIFRKEMTKEEQLKGIFNVEGKWVFLNKPPTKTTKKSISKPKIKKEVKKPTLFNKLFKGIKNAKNK